MHRWEMSAVWDCLCNKPIKSRMGGRVKQPAVYYGREKKRETERLRVGGTEQHLSGSSSSLRILLTFLYLFSFCFADIPLIWVNSVQVVSTTSMKMWRKKPRINTGVFPPFLPIPPLWVCLNGSVSFASLDFCSCENGPLKKIYYSSRAALNVPRSSTTRPTTNTNTPTHINTKRTSTTTGYLNVLIWYEIMHLLSGQWEPFKSCNCDSFKLN